MDFYTSNGVLYHHGVKGQEWGVRNGPPYPLSDKQKKKQLSDEEKKKIGKWGRKQYDKIGRERGLDKKEQELIKLQEKEASSEATKKLNEMWAANFKWASESDDYVKKQIESMGGEDSFKNEDELMSTIDKLYKDYHKKNPEPYSDEDFRKQRAEADLTGKLASELNAEETQLMRDVNKMIEEKWNIKIDDLYS